jgi:hypothetical protein
MAITAYASGDADPISNPDTDISIDLSALSLPQTIQCYGEGYDSANPSNTDWNWTWTVLDDDSPGSSFSLVPNGVVQNPTGAVPTWRNVRLFLIVQNVNTSVYSEQDPLLAPDSAFLVLRVLSTTAGLQKLAAGERDYHGMIHTVVAQVEADAAGVGAHTVASHSDTTATGAELETLTNGTSAAGLHTHGATDLPTATNAAQGAVTLEETGQGAAKVITRERVQLRASVDGSRVAGSGWVAGQILPPTYETPAAVSGGVPLAIWRADEALKIVNWAVQLVDGGKASPTSPYKFRLGVANATNAATDTWTDLGSELTGAPGADSKPLLLSGTLTSEHTLAAGEFIALFCLDAPKAVTDGQAPGGGLTAQVFARREVV